MLLPNGLITGFRRVETWVKNACVLSIRAQSESTNTWNCDIEKRIQDSRWAWPAQNRARDSSFFPSSSMGCSWPTRASFWWVFLPNMNAQTHCPQLPRLAPYPPGVMMSVGGLWIQNTHYRHSSGFSFLNDKMTNPFPKVFKYWMWPGRQRASFRDAEQATL